MNIILILICRVNLYADLIKDKVLEYISRFEYLNKNEG